MSLGVHVLMGTQEHRDPSRSVSLKSLWISTGGSGLCRVLLEPSSFCLPQWEDPFPGELSNSPPATDPGRVPRPPSS